MSARRIRKLRPPRLPGLPPKAAGRASGEIGVWAFRVGRQSGSPSRRAGWGHCGKSNSRTKEWFEHKPRLSAVQTVTVRAGRTHFVAGASSRCARLGRRRTRHSGFKRKSFSIDATFLATSRFNSAKCLPRSIRSAALSRMAQSDSTRQLSKRRGRGATAQQRRHISTARTTAVATIRVGGCAVLAARWRPGSHRP